MAGMHEATGLAFQIAMGLGLAASAGLRAFLPLLVVGTAGRMGWVPLAGTFDWLASGPALTILAVAVVAEILSDKIPLVDNLLDLLQGVVKPAAGAILAMSVLTGMEPLQAALLGLVAGGGTAGLVHAAKMKVRLFSSATTGGIGNPFLSVGEDAASLLGSITSLVVPFLILGLALLSMLALVLAIRTYRTRVARIEAERR